MAEVLASMDEPSRDTSQNQPPYAADQSQIQLAEVSMAPAYQAGMQGDSTLVQELQTIHNHPCKKQSGTIAHRVDQPRAAAITFAGGISHYSWSS